MSETILVRPLRGHQSRHLGRWVQGAEEPYACPGDEADRLVRHGCVEIVGGVDPAEEGGDVTATLGVDDVTTTLEDDDVVATLPGDDEFPVDPDLTGDPLDGEEES